MQTYSEGTIAVSRVWKRFREDRKPPALADQLGNIVNRLGRRSGWRWALRDIDFTVEPGTSVGVIGSNGAGKSTLLKILSQVMYPYAGGVELKGRVGALIELRGGMHPDLTGRENALFYGSILGIGRKTVMEKLDEIVDFGQLEGAIDRQVKFYSTGMQMRLGFAIASHLNPAILLVDEVLAVGDAWFQQRCLDRMRDMVSEGTTLLLVSHDLASIEALCRRGLWLDNGLLVGDGPIREVLSSYRKSVEEKEQEILSGSGRVRLNSVTVEGPDGTLPSSHTPMEVRLEVTCTSRSRGRMYVGVSEGAPTPVFLASTGIILEEGTTRVTCKIDSVPLAKGDYYAWVCMESVEDDKLIPWHPATPFTVFGTEIDWAPLGVVRLSPVHVKSDWEQSEISKESNEATA